MRWQIPQGIQIYRRGYSYQAQRTLVIPSHQPISQPHKQLEYISRTNRKAAPLQRPPPRLQADNRIQAQAN